jgi:cell wall-associated NlpC family hydrolase
MTPDQIAARALQQIGTPFRLFGRTPEVALDCVGLVSLATGISDDWRYALKGDYRQMVSCALEQNGICECTAVAAPENGDIALVQCASRQQHLMIRANDGWVHAHAGLGRVVHTPGNSPWPIVTLWRVKWQL